MPIPTRNIFWMKYLQSYIGIPLLAYVFFVIPLFVYGIVTGASSLYYPVMLVTLLAVTIIGLSIAYLFNLVDRKSTRLNSSHVAISYAVFCLKKKRIDVI